MTAENQQTLVEVQLGLAQLHIDRQEYASALDLLRAAARARDARAINMLGRAYERGWGVPPDAALAAAYYREAAELGDAWAKFNLADLYLRGAGVEQNDAEAHALYLEAAGQGHAKSLNMLGLVHEDGHVVPQNKHYALEFYLAGAEQGDCWAHLNAARLLMEQGKTAEAFSLLERSLQYGFEDYYRNLLALLSALRTPQALELAHRVTLLCDGAVKP